MRTPLLTLVLAAAFASSASALTIEALPETDLRRYAATLAEQAGSSQWQLLWQHTRAAGHFQAAGAQPRFTLPIPALVQRTLAQPDRIDRLSATRTRLRHNIGPRIAGEAAGTPLTAICLTVDWRGASEPTAGQAVDPASLRHVSLLAAEPC